MSPTLSRMDYKSESRDVTALSVSDFSISPQLTMYQNESKPKAIDLSHHLSNVSKARKTSPLKGLQRYLGKEGMVQMAGGECKLISIGPTVRWLIQNTAAGLPSPAYFPFSELSAEGLVPDSFPLSPTTSSPSAFSWLFKLFQTSKTQEKTTHLTIPKYPVGRDDLNLAVSLQYGKPVLTVESSVRPHGFITLLQGWRRVFHSCRRYWTNSLSKSTSRYMQTV